jgi:sugar phosphate isomerase/epimerase
VRKASVESLEDILKLGKEFSAKKAVVHATSKTHLTWDNEDVMDNIIKSLNELNEIASGYGIELLAENVFGDFFSIDEFDKLLNETEVNMCLDTGHARTSDFDGIFSSLKEMGWEGTLSIEPFTKNPEYIEICKEKLEELLK